MELEGRLFIVFAALAGFSCPEESGPPPDAEFSLEVTVTSAGQPVADAVVYASGG